MNDNKVKFVQEETMKGQRRSRWRLVNATSRPLYPQGRDTVPTVQKAGWASGPVWTGAKNLALTGVRSLDRQARMESLYRPRYLDPPLTLTPSHTALFTSCYLFFTRHVSNQLVQLQRLHKFIKHIELIKLLEFYSVGMV